MSISIDVAACEIAQPRPENFTSSIVSPSSAERDVDRDLVAAQRVLAVGVRVCGIEHAVPVRILVVVEDDLAVHLVELVHANTLRTVARPSTSWSISSCTVYR